MPTTIKKRKYMLLAIGLFILIMLVIGVFNALLFGREIFQGAAGEVGSARGATVQFDFQRAKGLPGISEQ